MVRGLFLFGILLAALINPVLAENNYGTECATPPDVPVHITPLFDAPTYNYDASIPEIKALSADAHHTIHESLTLGVTRYEPMIKISAPVEGLKFSDGRVCGHVDHVDVTVGFQNVIVYIARELPQDSCGFTEVMAHEQKHINVNLQILEEYIPRINNELSAYLNASGAFRDIDMDYGTKLIQDKMHEIVRTIMTDLAQENQTRQQAVDTPEEYHRISVSCNGQLQVIAAHFSRE
jgi:hypothetical protein